MGDTYYAPVHLFGTEIAYGSATPAGKDTMSTQRSRRRDAELAVIERARNVARFRSFFSLAGTEGQYAVSSLTSAVEALDAMAFEEPNATRTGYDNPALTSSMAGEWMQQHATDLAYEVYERIDAMYRAGWEGLTTEQIEERLNGKHQTISPRVTELRDRGFIMDSGLKRRNKSGRMAIVWKPTPAALEARRLIERAKTQ